MKSSIDLMDEEFGVTAERNLGIPGVEITLDNASIDFKLKLGTDKSIELGDALLEANGFPTISEWEDEVYKLQERINELEEIKEDYEERMECMRDKERYTPF